MKSRLFTIIGFMVIISLFLCACGTQTEDVIAPRHYITFTSKDNFTLEAANGITWDGSIEYSRDAVNWLEWDGSPIQADDNVYIQQPNKESYSLFVRGTNNTVISGGFGNNWTLSDNDIYCEGNIENLLDWRTVAQGGHPKMGDYCFQYMFAHNYGLINSPELSAITLSKGCYANMFSDCRIFTTAPELPATTLADECYFGMFFDCTGLREVPDILPAEKLANSCYESMFFNCVSLEKAPKLPAQSLTDSCYNGMFNGCTSLKQAPELPATTLAKYCYRAMFYNCESLTDIPALPALEIGELSYNEMFAGCKNICLSETKDNEYTKEFRLPAEGDVTWFILDFNDMFRDTGGTFTGTPECNRVYYVK